MTSQIHVYVGVLAALVSGPLVHTSQAQSSLAIVTTYEAVKADLTVHEPVFLRFVAESVLDFPVELDLGMNSYEYFQARITRPNGSVENMPSEAGLIAKMGISRKVSLLPHTPYTQLLLLNRWFDFDSPGRYTVELTLSAPVVTGTGTQLQYTATKEIVIDIQPRDPVRLQQICSDLAEASIGSPSAVRANEAAETLSYIKDPIAVAPLARLAQSGPMLESLVVYGLGRIGDGPAADVLISLADSSVNSREVALSVLWTIGKNTSDGQLKDRIARFLASKRPPFTSKN